MRVKISRGDWKGRDKGSSSALSLSLLCRFWVGDSSQGVKGLPGKRREVRICCLWKTVGLAEKLKAAAGGVGGQRELGCEEVLARLGAGALPPPCSSPMLRAVGTGAAFPSAPRQELVLSAKPKVVGT